MHEVWVGVISHDPVAKIGKQFFGGEKKIPSILNHLVQYGNQPHNKSTAAFSVKALTSKGQAKST